MRKDIVVSDIGPYEKLTIAGTPRNPRAGLEDAKVTPSEGPYKHVEIIGAPIHPLHRRGRLRRIAK
jgi:hypothetical protein